MTTDRVVAGQLHVQSPIATGEELRVGFPQ